MEKDIPDQETDLCLGLSGWGPECGSQPTRVCLPLTSWMAHPCIVPSTPNQGWSGRWIVVVVESESVQSLRRV